MQIDSTRLGDEGYFQQVKSSMKWSHDTPKKGVRRRPEKKRKASDQDVAKAAQSKMTAKSERQVVKRVKLTKSTEAAHEATTTVPHSSANSMTISPAIHAILYGSTEFKSAEQVQNDVAKVAAAILAIDHYILENHSEPIFQEAFKALLVNYGYIKI